MRPILYAKNLKWKVSNKDILDIKNLEIYEHERLALIGPNGSGKSSLLKILSFLENPTQGELRAHFSEDRKSLIEKRRNIAAVFQEPLLLNMSVEDNIGYGLKLRGIKKDRSEKIRYWMDRLSISHLKDRHPRNLSGGEAQRVSIARAMILEPKILFLDEPFSALDSPTKSQLLSELSQIIKEANITTVFITHDFSEIPFMADKVAVMYGGKIVQRGTVEDVFYRPANDEVAELVGADIKLSGYMIEDSRVSLEYGLFLDLPQNSSSITNSEVKCYIRPEDVMLGKGISNNFTGKIVAISPYGLNYKITLSCPLPISVILDKHKFINLKPEINNLLDINIPKNSIHVTQLQE